MQQASDERRHRRRIALYGAVAVFVIANAVAVHDLVATDASAARVRNDAQQTAAQLDARRSALATADAFRTSTLKLLESETVRRNVLRRQNTWIRAVLGVRTSAIVAAFAEIERQQGHMVSLSSCLTQVQAALNAVSVGDLASGSIALAAVRRLCEAPA